MAAIESSQEAAMGSAAAAQAALLVAAKKMQSQAMEKIAEAKAKAIQAQDKVMQSTIVAASHKLEAGLSSLVRLNRRIHYLNVK